MACRNHVPYATKVEAETALSRSALNFMLKSFDDSWKFLGVFPCGDHWHVGRKPASEQTAVQLSPLES
jgi:hypothetical protein